MLRENIPPQPDPLDALTVRLESTPTQRDRQLAHHALQASTWLPLATTKKPTASRAKRANILVPLVRLPVQNAQPGLSPMYRNPQLALFAHQTLIRTLVVLQLVYLVRRRPFQKPGRPVRVIACVMRATAGSGGI